MSDAAPPDPIESKRQFRRTLMIFALAGPYIGLGLSLLVMLIMGVAQGQSLAATLAAIVALGAISAVFAIPVAGLPGLLTGFVAAHLLRRNAETARYYALTACVGALSVLAIPLILHHGYEFWIFVAMATSLICARLARR